MCTLRIITHLQNGEVFEYTVHHVLFGQVLELLYEVDHVFAHRRPMDAVHKARILQPRVLGFHLLHHLFTERTDFRRARDHHVVVALVSIGKSEFRLKFELQLWALRPLTGWSLRRRRPSHQLGSCSGPPST